LSGSSDVDAHIAALPEDRRAPMAQLRDAIRAAAPGSEEAIAYKMPAFPRHGRFFIGYEAYKRHYSLFGAVGPLVEALGAELEPFVTGRGTISFPADQPIPLDLVRRIVEARLADVEAGARR
jgi:uncharacterized protein YdhG (YjbR/CyaY superfamily)